MQDLKHRLGRALRPRPEISPAERHLRSSLRKQGASIPASRRPSGLWQPWRNRALQSQAQVDQALAELAACGLPLHPAQPKNWDLLVALGSILDATSPRDRVLEMGATRYTQLLPWLYLYGYRHLVGIDLATQLDVAEGPIHSFRMDLTRTTFEDGSFGGIGCLSVIEHGVPLDAYVREAWRLLRPGGVLVTSTDFWCEPLDVQGKEAYDAPVHVFTPAELNGFAECAQDVGFRLAGALDLQCDERVVTWERVGLSYTFANMVLHKPGTRATRTRLAVRRATPGSRG